MTMAEIMKAELNVDLSLIKEWRRRIDNAESYAEAEMFRGCLNVSKYKADSKAELIQALGYTVLYNDDHDECISVYPSELDD